MTNFLRNAVNRIRRLVGLGDQEDQYEWVRVGEVSQLIVYPFLESSTKFVTQSAECTGQGLKYEGIFNGSFVIFRTTNRIVCTANEYPVMTQINIVRSDGMVSLESEFYPKIQFSLTDDDVEKLPITPIMLHEKDVIFVRDCGKAAGEWVSEYLLRTRRGMRLGYYIFSDYMDFLERNKDDWHSFLNARNNPLRFHLDVTNHYSLLSIPSFDKINDKLECVRGNLMEYDFRPNIIIQTESEDAFQEFKWKEIKIKDCTFECIPSCNLCSQSRIQNYFGSRVADKLIFIDKLKSLIKKYTKLNVKKSAVTLTIDMKLYSTESTIECGDSVYFKKKLEN